MHDISTPAFDAFGRAWATLTIGPAVIVLAAVLWERMLTGAVVRRSLWQGAVAGILALLVIEATGAGRAAALILGRLGETLVAEGVRGREAGGISAPAEEAPGPSTISSGLPEEPFAAGGLPELPTDGETEWARHGWIAPADRSPAIETAMAAAAPAGVDVAWDGDAAAAGLRGAQGQRGSADEGRQEPASGAEPARSSDRSGLLDRGVPQEALWVAAAVWGAGFLVLAGRSGWKRLQLAWVLWRRPIVEDPELAGEVAALSRRLGYRRRVRVGTIDRMPSPVALGFVRPTVLVPGNFARRFTPAEQRAIFAHEVAHLAAGDPAWLVAADVLTAVLWWHPMAWWCRRRLQTASEQAADEASAVLPDGPWVLADCLVKLGRRLAREPRIGWVAAEGAGLRSGLARRIEHLLSLGAGRDAPPAAPAMLIVKPAIAGLLVFVAIFCTLWVQPKATYAKGDETMNALRVSWRQSLAVAALAALLGPLGGDTPADEAPGQTGAVRVEEGSAGDAVQLAQRGERREGEGERDGEKREARGEHPREAEREREQPERARGEQERERAEDLRDRIEVMAREIRELHQAGRHEEAEKLQREVAEVTRRMAGSREGDRPGPRGMEHPEMRERLEGMMREARELKAAGRHEEAERLQHRIEEMRGRAAGPPELRARAGHLRMAIENLRAAGLHEQAEQVEQTMARLMRELAPEARERAMPPGMGYGMGPGMPGMEHGMPPREGRPEGPPEARALVGELRGEIERLRRETDELRRMMNQLREGQERLLRELKERQGEDR